MQTQCVDGLNMLGLFPRAEYLNMSRFKIRSRSRLIKQSDYLTLTFTINSSAKIVIAHCAL